MTAVNASKAVMDLWHGWETIVAYGLVLQVQLGWARWFLLITCILWPSAQIEVIVTGEQEHVYAMTTSMVLPVKELYAPMIARD